MARQRDRDRLGWGGPGVIALVLRCADRDCALRTVAIEPESHGTSITSEHRDACRAGPGTTSVHCEYREEELWRTSPGLRHLSMSPMSTAKSTEEHDDVRIA